MLIVIMMGVLMILIMNVMVSRCLGVLVWRVNRFGMVICLIIV